MLENAGAVSIVNLMAFLSRKDLWSFSKQGRYEVNAS
jgi:hypothetical protein